MECVFFTIIVPVYNVDKYLEECIQSVLKQNYNNYELVLIDDGSTDGSSDICKYYAASNDKITFVQQLNQGVSVARNNGISIAQGDYLIFLDSDDWLNYQALSRFNASIVENQYPDIVQSAYAIVQTESVRSVIPKVAIYNVFEEYVNSNNYINAVFSYCIKRNIVAENSIEFPKGVKYAEDLEFILKVFFFVKRVVCLSDILYYYRIRPMSAMTVRPVYSSALDNLIVASHLFDALNLLQKKGNFDFVKQKAIKLVNSFLVRLSMCSFTYTLILKSTKDYRAFYDKYKETRMLFPVFYRVTYISTVFCVLYLRLFWKNKIVTLL